MRPYHQIFALLLAMLCITSCKDTPETLEEERMKLFQETTTILNNISDDKNVEKNLDLLEKWAEQMRDNQTKIANLREDQLDDKKLKHELVLELNSSPEIKKIYELYTQAFYKAYTTKHASIITVILKDIYVPFIAAKHIKRKPLPPHGLKAAPSTH